LNVLISGANAQIANRDGWSPLHLAAAKGELLSLHAIMEACSTTVDLNQQALDGATAVFLATQVDNQIHGFTHVCMFAVDIISWGNFLFQFLCYSSLYLYTSRHGNSAQLPCVCLLVSFLVLQENRLKVVSALVDAALPGIGRGQHFKLRRADLNMATTADHKTPLIAAAERSHAEVIISRPGMQEEGRV